MVSQSPVDVGRVSYAFNEMSKDLGQTSCLKSGRRKNNARTRTYNAPYSTILEFPFVQWITNTVTGFGYVKPSVWQLQFH